MPSSNRRVFLLCVAAGSTGLGVAARAQSKVDEKDPQAVALGFVLDATRADGKKYPRYAAGQMCANCALYQGKPSDPAGACALFAGRQVPGKGWCSAWAKKG